MEECLRQMILAVKKRRDDLEYECSLLKGLLKPWPKEKTAASMSSQGKSTSLQWVTERNDGVPVEPHPPPQEPALTAVEEQALSQLDKILQKAAQARQSKGKLHKSEEKGRGPNLNATSGKRGEASGCERTASSQSADLGGTDVGKTQTQMSKSENGADSSKGRKSCGSRSNVTSLGKNVTPAATTDKGRSSSSSPMPLSAGRSRPASSSGRGRPASSKSGHIPAHMSAPFKTKPETAVRGGAHRKQTRQISQQTRLQRSGATSGLLLGNKTYKTLPGIKAKQGQVENTNAPLMPASSPESGGIYQPCPDTIQSGASGSPTQQELKYSSFDEIVGSSDSTGSERENAVRTCTTGHDLPCDGHDRARDTVTVHSKTIQQSQKDLVSDDRDGQDINSCHAAEVECPKSLDLKTIGPSLRLPARLLKLFSLNNSLRQKCRNAQLTRKVMPVDPAQHFVDRLRQSQCAPGAEMYHRAQALACLHEHNTLLDVLKDLNLERLSESSPYEELVRAKTSLEFVLSKFAELEEKSTFLSQVQFRELPHEDLVVESASESLPVLLASQNLHHGPVWQMREPGLLGEQLAACSEWQELQFSLCRLELLAAVTRRAKSEWWPALEKENGDPAVLEAVHSLLTSAAQFLPAFVQNPHQL
ncbi:uncharacterized protein LOC101858095 isoform X2 [Aplysia californica]|uniref:Uncharacterized protein LOC101858095 isoform X2 n=1 Tax=Aplysia californica TaxID=6500 RepID=A0ABM0ZWK4_APLCA|nr:uncharacterized protein LOC101858095 isoform X2 [Aplysia californica]